MPAKNIQIGRILLDKGYIDEKQLARAIELQKNMPGKRLGDVLTELSYVTEEQIAKTLAEQLNIQFVNLSSYQIDSKAVSLLDAAYCKLHCVLPIGFRNDQLIVAVQDPLAYYTFEEIRSMTGREVLIMLSVKSTLQQVIEQAYSKAEAENAEANLNEEYGEQQGDMNLAEMDDRVETSSLARMINMLIIQAATAGVSDIHFEPTRNSLEVRFRENGDLVHHTTMRKAVHNAVVTRIKLLSDMNIAEKRIPQDGKIHFTSANFEIDIRVSSLPTIYGEKIVLRLLGNTAHPELMDLKRIGMDDWTSEHFNSMIKAPNGIILVTGPTGSGKTTTLYATLNQLSQKPVNIVTIEDPVEQRIDGINQIQVNNKAGLTFASALRSILRQDPDIIMVGEMRDEETAELGMRAAITGHLVLSTLHTNDTVSSIARLVDMKIPPYMVAASLSGVIAQRLVKKLCPNCREQRPVSEREKASLGKGAEDIQATYHPVGCPHCNNTGYSGRRPIYECIHLDGTLRNMITDGKSVYDMRNYERSKGNRFLKDNVLDMVRRGETGIEEMERVVYSVDD